MSKEDNGDTNSEPTHEETVRPERTDPLQPDIPTYVTDIDEARQQARADKSIWSSRSRYQDPIRWLEFEVGNDEIDEMPGSDFPDEAKRIERRDELKREYGVEENFDEASFQAEIARRKHWVEVFYEHPEVAKLGFTVDSLLQEEDGIARNRSEAESVVSERQKALKLQEEETFDVRGFIREMDMGLATLIGAEVNQKFNELYTQRDTTVGQLNDVVFDALANYATGVSERADARQKVLDNLAQGILPDNKTTKEEGEAQ